MKQLTTTIFTLILSLLFWANSIAQNEMPYPFEYPNDFIKKHRIKKITEKNEEGKVIQFVIYDTMGNFTFHQENDFFQNRQITNVINYDQNGTASKTITTGREFTFPLTSYAFRDSTNKIDSIYYDQIIPMMEILGFAEKKYYNKSGQLEQERIFCKTRKYRNEIFTDYYVRQYYYQPDGNKSIVKLFLVGLVNGTETKLEVFNTSYQYYPNGKLKSMTKLTVKGDTVLVNLHNEQGLLTDILFDSKYENIDRYVEFSEVYNQFTDRKNPFFDLWETLFFLNKNRTFLPKSFCFIEHQDSKNEILKEEKNQNDESIEEEEITETVEYEESEEAEQEYSEDVEQEYEESTEEKSEDVKESLLIHFRCDINGKIDRIEEKKRTKLYEEIKNSNPSVKVYRLWDHSHKNYQEFYENLNPQNGEIKDKITLSNFEFECTKSKLYDKSSNCITETKRCNEDESDVETIRCFDTENRLIEETRREQISKDRIESEEIRPEDYNYTINYFYDKQGNRLMKKNAGFDIKYYFDADSNISKYEIFSDENKQKPTNIATYRYETNGNYSITKQSYRGEGDSKTETYFAANGKILKKINTSYEEINTTTYAYDENWNIILISHYSGEKSEEEEEMYGTKLRYNEIGLCVWIDWPYSDENRTEFSNYEYEFWP